MSEGAPRILAIDDEEHFLVGLRLTLLQEGLTVVTESDPARGLRRIREEAWDLVLLDLNMPGVHGFELLEASLRERPEADCIVITAVNEAASAVQALRAGAVDYLSKPLEPPALVSAVRAALARRAVAPAACGGAGSAFQGVVTASPRMLAVFRYLERVAPTDEHVLIRGATGTGKERLARAVHTLSGRKGPFVGVNAAAIPASLFQSQLFGHVAGAFSGAEGARGGFFAEAAGGTLFLDEVSALDPGLQATLLRVLQEREYYRVGESAVRPLTARLIMAANTDLAGEVARGRMREDFYYRIIAISVELPPLSERPEDIPLLAAHFTRELGRRLNQPAREVHPDALEALCAASFPGNVRELENVIREGVLRETSALLRRESLPAAYRGRRRARPASSDGELRPMAELEREHILRTLEATGGNVTQAARMLGVSRATLNRRLKAYRDP